MNLTTSYLLCHGLISFLSPYNFIRGIDKTTTNDGNARRVRLNGKSNDMELSDVEASERELDFVSDEPAERFSSLGAADVTPDKSKVRQSLMSSESLESRTGSVFRPAVSVTQNMGSKSESVFCSTSSAAQNFRFPNSTVRRPAITPISSPVFAGFSQNEGSEDGKQKDFDES